MKTPLVALSVFVVTLLVAPGCRSSELVAPNASEPIAVSVQDRTAPDGERIPRIYVSASAGSVAVRVTRGALCGTRVNAAVNRGAGEVDVVSHVSANPSLLCAPTPARAVVDYAGTVSSLSAGRYRIRVFEGVGDGTPRFIGSAFVTVPRPAA